MPRKSGSKTKQIENEREVTKLMKGKRKALTILKDNLLVGAAVAAFLTIAIQLNDPTPLGNAGEIAITAVSFIWLMVFGYAQITR